MKIAIFSAIISLLGLITVATFCYPLVMLAIAIALFVVSGLLFIWNLAGFIAKSMMGK